MDTCDEIIQKGGGPIFVFLDVCKTPEAQKRRLSHEDYCCYLTLLRKRGKTGSAHGWGGRSVAGSLPGMQDAEFYGSAPPGWRSSTDP